MGAINTIDVTFRDVKFTLSLTADVYDMFKVIYNTFSLDVTTSDQFVDFLLTYTYSEDDSNAREQAEILYDVFMNIWEDYKLLDDIDDTSVEIISIEPISYIYGDNGVIIDSEKSAIEQGTEHIYSKLININKGITELSLNNASVGYDYFDTTSSADITTNIEYGNRSFYFNLKGRPERKGLWNIDLNTSLRYHKQTYKDITNLNLVNMVFPFKCLDMRSPSASFNHSILSIELEQSRYNFSEKHTLYKKRLTLDEYRGSYYNLFMPMFATMFQPDTYHTFSIYLRKDIQYPPYGIGAEQLIGQRSAFLSQKQYDIMVNYLDYNNMVAILLIFQHLENTQTEIVV